MANLSSVFIERPCSPLTSTEQWEAFQPVSPDISVAKGHQEGHLQQGAINSFYIGSFFTRLPLARTPRAHALLPDICRAESSRRDAQPSSSCHTPGCARPCRARASCCGTGMPRPSATDRAPARARGWGSSAGQGPPRLGLKSPCTDRTRAVVFPAGTQGMQGEILHKCQNLRY